MICPFCHNEVIRAKMGSGTMKGKGMALNENRNILLALFRQEKRPLTIRDIQHLIFEKNLRRISNRGVGWNYHTIQADVSILVGGGYLKMADRYETNQDTESFYTTKDKLNSVPEYILSVKV